METPGSTDVLPIIDMSEFEADFGIVDAALNMGNIALHDEVQLLGSPIEPGAIITSPLTAAEVDRITAELEADTVQVSLGDQALVPGIAEMLTGAAEAQERQDIQLETTQAIANILLQDTIDHESALLTKREEDKKKAKKKKKKDDYTKVA